MRAIAYSLLGALGIALVVYLGERALFLFSKAEPLSGSIAVLALASATLLMAALANFAVAYALTAGRVFAVRGSREEAELVSKDGDLITRARIRFVANLDRNATHTPADRQQVIFLAGLRPSSCTASTFLL